MATESAEALLEKASELSGLTTEEIITTRRAPNYIWRFAVMARMRDEGFTFPTIASIFHRNHSSVINGIKRVRACMEYPRADLELRGAYSMLKRATTPWAYDNYFVTSKDKIERWLTNANVPYQTRQELMLTLSTIK